MRNLLSAAAGALFLAGAFGAPGAIAAPMSIDRLSLSEFSLKQDVQYFYSGRKYCFYPNGWRGPGFYWCGYNWRRGYGWGGPMGWRGWAAPGPRFYDRGYGRRRYEMRRVQPRREHREMRRGRH